MAMEIANYTAWVNGADYSFKSAGIALVGGQPDENVARVLSEISINSLPHNPVSINSCDITEFDAIHVMNQRQKITLCSYYNAIDIADKITVLNVDDPFSKGIGSYRNCRDTLVHFYERFVTNEK